MSSATASGIRRDRPSATLDAPAGRVASRMDAPTTSYYLVVAVVSLLVGIGLVMVLSASMVVAAKESGSSFGTFLKQLLFAALGTVVIAWACRRTPAFWRRVAPPALLATILLQALVLFTPFGAEVNGNRNWLDLGVVMAQPSELGKIALVLYGATMLTRRRSRAGNLTDALVPFVIPGAAGVLLGVMLGHDLGTALVLCAIVAAVLFAAGVPGRYFAAGGALAAVLITLVTVTSENRMTRIRVWLDPSSCDPFGACRQPLHGRYALADGGWWGVGLGQSREKWGWLSEPHNDFIFAIIGEELGLFGSLLVLGLFAAFALVSYRIVSRTQDQFVRIATAGILAWVTVQAIVNIGAVIGLLPVIGVPLPLVSSGGSALVTTMLAAGILLSFARAEPGCAEALAVRRGMLRRTLAVVPVPRRRAGSLPTPSKNRDPKKRRR